MFKYVPNILTIIRFILIPFILDAIVKGNYILAIVVFTISGVTDVLDGYIARKFNFITNFGKLMDPLADKLTQVSVLMTLVIVKIIPLWILIVVILKELVMVIGASFLYGKNVVVYSKWYGKLATVLLYLAIVFSLLVQQLHLTGIWVHLDLVCFCLAIVCTIFSLVMYAKYLYAGGFIDKNDIAKDDKINKI